MDEDHRSRPLCATGLCNRKTRRMITDTDLASIEKPTLLPEPTNSNPLDNSPRRRWVGVLILGAIVLAGVLAWSLGGVRFSSEAGRDVLTHTAQREPLRISVTEGGNLESASNVEIKCEVAGGSTILWIIEDGKQVEEGQIIVRLDQSTINEQLNAQKIVYNRAKAAKIQAQHEYEMTHLL